MGAFREKVIISNPDKPDYSTEIDMVVDSGATYSWVPGSLLSKLLIEPKLRRELKLADGTVIERKAAIANITLKAETLPSLIVFGDESSEALLGAVTLEEFGLAVDPVNKTLIPVPALLL